MNPEIKALWLTELRSGKYEQVKSSLRNTDEEGRVGYCCLGVLCELAEQAGVVTRTDPDDIGDSRYQGADRKGARFNITSTTYLPDAVIEWSGLGTDDGDIPGTTESLASLNDHGSTFEEIADVIEEKF